MNSAAAQPAPDGQKPPTRRRVWIAAAAGAACLIGGAAVWAASSDGTAPATSPTPATTASGMPTAEPQASASPSPAPSPSMVAACAARMVITNEWQGGYQADVTVTARGTITDWTVTLALGTSTVKDSWNSTLKPGATGAATAANVDYNGSVAAGAETAFGFTATGEAPADLSAGCSSTAGNVRAAGSGPGETPGDAVGAPPATYTSRSNVNSPADDDWLQTDGNRIVDADGNPVWLTGANWYGFNISQRVFSGLSAANHDDLMDQIASRGINVIRVPISTELLLEWKAGQARVPTAVNQTLNPDLVGKTSLEVFEVFLGDAKDRGVKVILDVHSALADDSGHMAPLWYHGDVSTADFLDAWEWTAERYKGDDTIVGYDLKNEPHGQPQEERRAIWDGSTAQNNWRHAAELAGERILRANPHALIIVEGIEATPKSGTSFASTNNDDYDFGWWGGNLRMADDFPVRLSVAHRLVYSPHDYGPLVYEQPYFQQPFTAASLERDVWEPNWLYLHGDDTAPLLIGEWGGRLGQDARQDTWMRALRDLIVDEHLAHTFWCINPESGDTGGLFTDGWQGWDEEKYALLRPALWQDRDGRFVSLDHVTALPGGVSVAQYYSAGNAPPS